METQKPLGIDQESLRSFKLLHSLPLLQTDLLKCVDTMASAASRCRMPVPGLQPLPPGFMPELWTLRVLVRSEVLEARSQACLPGAPV